MHTRLYMAQQFSDFLQQRIPSFFSYHTLADERILGSASNLILRGTRQPTMTKAEVLSIFDRAGDFLTPDQVCTRLQTQLDRRSMYSYLLRLNGQSLLERKQAGRGSLAYRLTERGRARLTYLKRAR
jgi:hypothetical protein